MATGVVNALQAVGLAGKVAVSGMDGESAALTRIALGTQTVSVWSDPGALGTAAGNAALQLCGDPKIADVAGVVPFRVPSRSTITSVMVAPVAITWNNLDVVVRAGWITTSTLCDGVQAGSVAACP